MPRRSTWYAFVRLLVRHTFFAAKGGIRGRDAHNIPREGPVLFAPNHVSYLDPPAVACAQNVRQLRFMARASLFRNPLFAAVIRSLGAFPVNRGESDTESIRTSLDILEEGGALLVFPEGTRGDGTQLLPMNRGVGLLAKRSGAKVVPVAMVGTHLVMPREGKGRRHRMVVAFGEPFDYAEIVARAGSEKAARDLFVQELETRIAELCRANGLEVRTAAPASATPAADGREPETAPSPTA